jgi:hypothetical protein
LDNEATDVLAWLGSSHEPPPSGVFTHDSLKPSIRLKEDILARSPRASLDEGSSIPILGTLPEENGPALISEASPKASAGPTTLNPGPKGKIAVVVRPPRPEVDW